MRCTPCAAVSQYNFRRREEQTFYIVVVCGKEGFVFFLVDFSIIYGIFICS